ncbi:MAG: beta-galactosidase, partial [Kiritimatiellae bacterium]|nr:beta-galactosidase [Kiritimatiellia bacterium]
MTIRTVASAGFLTATLLLQPALSGTAVAWRDSGGSVQVDTDTLRCTISPKGNVRGGLKTIPGAFGGVIRNRKGEGVAGSNLDGNMDNWPASLFVQDSCRGTLELLEDGPLRIVARFTLQGATRSSPTGAVLKIERLLTVWADSGAVFTEFHFGSKTPLAYPWALLAFTDPKTRKTADVLDLVTSSGATGQAPTHTNGQWLAARLETEPAWAQLQFGDVTFGYIFPPGGALEVKTFTSGKGEQASDLCTLSYRGTCGDGPAYAWPLALVFADQNRLGAERTAKHVADRYFPDGRPRGIAVRTRPAAAGTIAIEVAETAGLNRNNVGLELELPTMPTSSVLRLEKGPVLGYQFKNHDPSTRTIAFQLPELKANETAALLLAPGKDSGKPSSLRESWSRTQRSIPLDGPPSPHVAWAKPRTSKLQAFFFTDWSRSRDLFELQQRLDMDCDYALTSGGALLMSDSLWLRGAGRRLGETEEAMRLLGNFRHDAIVIPDQRTYDSLPDDLKTLIRERVMKGVGLVLLNGAKLPDAKDAELPACLAGNKITVQTLGRGRIVASAQGYDFDLIPKAMLWAAGVSPAAQIQRVDFPATQVRGVPATAALELLSALRTNADYRLEARILSQAGEVVAGTNRVVTLEPGVNLVPWEMNGNLRAETFRLGFVLRDLDGNAIDYSCRNFSVESKTGIAGIVVATNTLRAGETLSGSCQVSGQGVLTLSLKDTWGRVVQRQSMEAKGDGSEVPFSFPAIETESFLLSLEAELADAAGPIARKSVDIHISRPRRLDDLRIEAYMLRDCSSLALERLREAGVDAGGAYFAKFNESNILAMRRNNVDIVANMTYGMPAAAAPPIRDGEPSKWPAPTDDDPHNIRMWDKRPSCPQSGNFAWSPGAYRRSAGDMPERYSPFTYDLCDEFIFQRHVYDLKGGWPYDELCFCRRSLEAFRAWLRSSYGSLESLNRQWDTAYGSWEEVIPPPARMARLKENVSAWLDFRIFLAEDVAHRLAAKQNGELPPGAAASANILFEGPFSTFMAYYLFGPGGLNASDCYADTLDKVRSFNRHPENRRIVLGYTAWGETTEGFFGNCWRNVLHGGGRIGVYNAMETCMDSSVLTPTYGEGELWEKVRTIRRKLGDSGIAKMMLTSQPAPTRIGVLQSYRSGFAAFLEPRNYDAAGWLAAKDGFARHFDAALAAAPGFAASAEHSRLGWRYLADEQLSVP